MLLHEEEILKIAYSEIRKTQEECNKVLRKYSQLVQEKNISVEILDLKYEVKYFQNRASELYEENKKLKE